MTETFLKLDKSHFNKGLKPLELLILAQVEEFVRNGCECYVTNQQFAEMFSVTQPTVDAAIKRLEELNYIRRDTKVTAGNNRANRVRKLLLVNPPKLREFRVSF
jgi:DNA-binding MarR family transcriptional regulator